MSLGKFAEGQSSLAVLGPQNSTTASSLLPLPECFLNQLGMVCCNRVVEEMIYRANDAMINANVGLGWLRKARARKYSKNWREGWASVICVKIWALWL
jgi:hypothetical protein